MDERAYIYARFSSDKQTEASIDAQVRACRDYAAAHGLTVIDVYADEAISGKGSKTASRAQYQKLLRDCAKGRASVILIHKYDRVARNIGEHVNLEAKLKALGIRLVATAQDYGQSNEAKILRTLTWAMSEYYLDNLADETRKGLRETALKGLHTGGCPPFGYDVVDQRYVINELEAGYVRRIFAAAQSLSGFTDILAEMRAAGIRGKRGKVLQYTQIYEMLRNEKYTGVYAYSPEEEKDRAARRTKPNAIRIENALPAIIGKAQFMEVQSIMDGRKQTGHRNGYLCSGLVYCQCGAKMHGAATHRKGHEYRYYVCSKQCGAPVAKVEDVDDAARRYLHTLLSPENQETVAVALRQWQAGEGNRAETFRAAQKQRIRQRQSEYDALMQNLASGALPPEVAVDVGQRMKEIKAEIAALEASEPPTDYTVDYICRWLTALRDNPDDAAVHLLVERIDVKQKTDISITSTLTSVLGKNGCGGRT